MKIIQDKQRRGIFIPTDEFEKVIKWVKTDSELFRLLNDEPERSIFDLKISEISDRLLPIATGLANAALKNGLYTSSRIVNTKQFLHRYADGRIELIERDEDGGKKVMHEYR